MQESVRQSVLASGPRIEKSAAYLGSAHVFAKSHDLKRGGRFHD